VYVHFSQISFPARYSVVNLRLESHSLRFREVIITPAFQVISVIRPPGLPGKNQTARIGKRAYEPFSSLSLV
ncbi:hypothetical protein, partial [uncultured Phocaeicola sp.]|uniref:hypothetical protein n=1 Tax=uncultured Phocaeicola sp. TaxID=990718 RepID=UPI0026171073